MVNLLLNFLFRRNISSETSGKLKNSWHWLTISEDPVLNILNKMRLRGNPSDLSCEELNGNASDAYSRQGIHLALIKFNITSSEATRPILPKIPMINHQGGGAPYKNIRTKSWFWGYDDVPMRVWELCPTYWGPWLPGPLTIAPPCSCLHRVNHNVMGSAQARSI